MKNVKAEKTISTVFRESCTKYADKPALREKDFGIWEEYSYREYYEKAKYFALGMKSLGFNRGEKVSISGNNEIEWCLAMFAVITAGGTLVAGIYQDSSLDEIKYIIKHAGATFVVVEDQEQVDKMLEIRSEIPDIKYCIFWDPKGLWNYDDPWLLDFYNVLAYGRKYEEEHPGEYERDLDESHPDDLAALYYTSGTTGVPKGVMYTHRTMLLASEGWAAAEYTQEGDDLFSLTPLAWISDPLGNILPALVHGAVVNIPEEPSTIGQNIREIGYQAGFAGIRAIEAQVSEVQVKISDSGFLQRMVYNLFMPVGYKLADAWAEGKRLSGFWRLLWNIGYWVLFRPLQDRLGYARARALVTGGAALAPDAFRYFHAIGIGLMNGYGLTELTPIAEQRLNRLDAESVGFPTEGYEVRIADNQEILGRSGSLTPGYYKDPEATSRAIDKQGWLHTGDAGFINDNGELVILDRLKDLMRRNDGTGFAPQYIENKLKFSPFVREAVVLGDGRDYLAALISIDFPICSKWADKHQLIYTTFMDLSQKDELDAVIRDDIIKRVNRALPEEAGIKKFTLLPKELDADDAELTRTRKLRRGFISQRYEEYIEALYSGEKERKLKTKVTYRDGRKSEVETLVRIVDVE